MTIHPKNPPLPWLNQYLEPNLVTSAPYKIDAHLVPCKLDQNESPYDWPADLKQKIVSQLLEQPWNRYPAPYPKELEALVADYVGVDPEAILLGPGSNYLIALLLSMFSRQKQGKIVVARPSFALYESHCRYEGIVYEPWLLNKDLQFDVNHLPELVPGSMVIFASPNNPVGNVLSRETFNRLLESYPECLFVADEAYFEFADEPYTPLLQNHSNLILVRTFSKTMGAAGIRLGYLVAAEAYLAQLRKMTLPYLINRFTIVAITEVLKDKAAVANFLATVTETIAERENLRQFLHTLESKLNFQVIPSQANFLLLRFASSTAMGVVYHQLIESGILLRDVSKGPGLEGCMRLTIGNKEENRKVMDAFSAVSSS
jgi:histidinol-phosphate aminotransferase